MKFDWKPISEIPEEYKDGREVLCRAVDYIDPRDPKDIPVDDDMLVHEVMRWHRDRLEGYYDGTSPKAVFFCTVLDPKPQEVFTVIGFMRHSDSDWVQSYHHTREGAEKARAEAQAKEDAGDADFGYSVYGPFVVKD